MKEFGSFFLICLFFYLSLASLKSALEYQTDLIKMILQKMEIKNELNYNLNQYQ